MKEHTVAKFRSRIKEPYLLQLIRSPGVRGYLSLLPQRCSEDEYEKLSVPSIRVDSAMLGFMWGRLTMRDVAVLHKEGKLSDGDVAAAMEILL